MAKGYDIKPRFGLQKYISSNQPVQFQILAAIKEEAKALAKMSHECGKAIFNLKIVKKPTKPKDISKPKTTLTTSDSKSISASVQTTGNSNLKGEKGKPKAEKPKDPLSMIPAEAKKNRVEGLGIEPTQSITSFSVPVEKRVSALETTKEQKNPSSIKSQKAQFDGQNIDPRTRDIAAMPSLLWMQEHSSYEKRPESHQQTLNFIQPGQQGQYFDQEYDWTERQGWPQMEPPHQVYEDFEQGQHEIDQYQFAAMPQWQPTQISKNHLSGHYPIPFNDQYYNTDETEMYYYSNEPLQHNDEYTWSEPTQPLNISEYQNVTLRGSISNASSSNQQTSRSNIQLSSEPNKRGQQHGATSGRVLDGADRTSNGQAGTGEQRFFANVLSTQSTAAKLAVNRAKNSGNESEQAKDQLASIDGQHGRATVNKAASSKLPRGNNSASNIEVDSVSPTNDTANNIEKKKKSGDKDQSKSDKVKKKKDKDEKKDKDTKIGKDEKKSKEDRKDKTIKVKKNKEAKEEKKEKLKEADVIENDYSTLLQVCYWPVSELSEAWLKRIYKLAKKLRQRPSELLKRAQPDLLKEDLSSFADIRELHPLGKFLTMPPRRSNVPLDSSDDECMPSKYDDSDLFQLPNGTRDFGGLFIPKEYNCWKGVSQKAEEILVGAVTKGRLGLIHSDSDFDLKSEIFFNTHEDVSNLGRLFREAHQESQRIFFSHAPVYDNCYSAERKVQNKFLPQEDVEVIEEDDAIFQNYKEFDDDNDYADHSTPSGEKCTEKTRSANTETASQL